MKSILLALALTSSAAYSATISQCTVQCIQTNLAGETSVTVVSALGSTLEAAKAATKAKCLDANMPRAKIASSETLNDSGNRWFKQSDNVLDSQCSTLNF